MPKQVFFATLGTETNSFSPIPAGWNVWRDTLLRRRSDGRAPADRGQHHLAPLWTLSEQRGWSLTAGLQAFAAPSGITPAPVWASLRDELLADLAAAGPVGAVLLHLHGAMIADGCSDCEGQLLAAVRDQVGPDVPIGALLDLHCHLTPAMVEHADVLFGYREYPHVDTFTRLAELLSALIDTAEGRIHPRMALADCAMIGMFPTTQPAMAALVERFRAASAAPGMVDVWLGHGFPWGDVPDLGMRVLAIADGDAEVARRWALDLATECFELRETIAGFPATLEATLDAAAAEAHGTVVIADTADNTGGGAPGDSTFFLRALLDRGIDAAALGPLYDPGAVRICQDAGLGARLPLRIGGKLAPESGSPVDVRVEVIGLADRLLQTLNAAPANLGACAGVRVLLDGDRPGPAVVLASRRVQAGSPELFTGLGIEPGDQRLLVVKSTQHFHAGFAPLASRILYAGEPGALAGDPRRIPYRHAPSAALWPLATGARPRGLLS